MTAISNITILRTPKGTPHRNKFLMAVEFRHDDSAIIEHEQFVFEGDDVAGLIAFYNAISDVGDWVSKRCASPDEEDVDDLPNVEVWLAQQSAWPSDDNGNYFAELGTIEVTYFDDDGIEFPVSVVY